MRQIYPAPDKIPRSTGHFRAVNAWKQQRQDSAGILKEDKEDSEACVNV